MQSSSALCDAPDPSVAPLRDNEFLVDLIAGISGGSRDEVIRRFVLEHEDLGANVREAMNSEGIKPFVWSSELEAFYASTDAFLYETLVWNRTATKIDMRRWIGSHLQSMSDAPQRVLTYGDGLGLDAYYLAEAGHEVTYFDISNQCAQFARRIFDQGDFEIEMVSDVSEVPTDSFDVVVCLDVLEHVPDPVALVAWLTQRLSSRGAWWFTLRSTFSTRVS
jgi:2-polyprenyl-3-methyl-5-hydroxy-6-metoxy-1,4-benzoquinol methylase